MSPWILMENEGKKKGHLWDRGEIHDLVSVIKTLTDGSVNQPHSLGCLIPPERTVRANSVRGVVLLPAGKRDSQVAWPVSN